MPVGYTILLLSAKTRQGKQHNEASHLRKCFKRTQRYHSLGMRRSLFVYWIHYIAAKKPQSLCENWNEKGIGKKELLPQANYAQYNMQGENGGGG